MESMAESFSRAVISRISGKVQNKTPSPGDCSGARAMEDISREMTTLFVLVWPVDIVIVIVAHDCPDSS